MRVDGRTPFVFALAAALPLAVLFAQPQVSLKEALRIYLLEDCGTGERNPRLSLDRVVAFGAEAVPLLTVAVKEGPDANERAQLERDAIADFRRLRAHLKEGGLREVREPDVRASAELLDEKTYVAMRQRSFVSGYQERAVNALVALGKPEAVAALRELAADPKLSNDLKEAVAEALTRLGSRP